ncbi:MAG: peptidylprolyl isomerase [Polyangiales bacterium]
MRGLGFAVAFIGCVGCLGLAGCPAFTPNEAVSEPDPAAVRGQRATAPKPAAPSPHGGSPHGGAPQGADAPEMATAAHILIRYAGAMRTTAEITRTKDDARKLADDVARKASTTGADFVALANQYTEDPSGKGTGGKLGTFPKGRMVPEFDKPLFALKPGETSDVIETPFGFHIIHREN